MQNAHNQPVSASVKLGFSYTEQPVDRVEATLAYIAAKPLAALIRSHGFPCRNLADGRLQVASRNSLTHGRRMGAGRVDAKWHIDTISANRETVAALLGI